MEMSEEIKLLQCDCEGEKKYRDDISALYFIKALRFNTDPSFEEVVTKYRPDLAKKYFCSHFRVKDKEQAQEFIRKSFDLYWKSRESAREVL